VIEIDIQKYFDSIPHTRLMDILRQRVVDGVLVRLIGRWIHAGVLERGMLMHSRSGTPQGGVISPLLANIFLHTVLDEWFDREVKPRLGGKGWLFRYADDAILLFDNDADVGRVLEVHVQAAACSTRVHPEGAREGDASSGHPNLRRQASAACSRPYSRAVYEQDFHDCSYGFRPGRSAHQLLEDFWSASTRTAGGWVIEMDIEKYFDSIPHAQLMGILRQRVVDGVLLRLIGKWIHAGVLDRGAVTRPRSVSPLLANIFLHTVIDEWFEREVKPRLIGRGRLFRYADDAVLLCVNEADAKRVLEVLSKRASVRDMRRLKSSDAPLVECSMGTMRISVSRISRITLVPSGTFWPRPSGHGASG
jgi:retron-type reverse transcriptase